MQVHAPAIGSSHQKEPAIVELFRRDKEVFSEAPSRSSDDALFLAILQFSLTTRKRASRGTSSTIPPHSRIPNTQISSLFYEIMGLKSNFSLCPKFCFCGAHEVFRSRVLSFSRNLPAANISRSDCARAKKLSDLWYKRVGPRNTTWFRVCKSQHQTTRPVYSRIVPANALPQDRLAQVIS